MRATSIVEHLGAFRGKFVPAAGRTWFLLVFLAALPGQNIFAQAPSITLQPANQNAPVGGTASFSVAASGTGPLSYQWRFNGTNLPNFITTVAGNGTNGFSGDGGKATNASFFVPGCVAKDNFGNLFICDVNNRRIRKVATNGVVTTVAGNGTYGYSGDGGLATNAQVVVGYGLAVDGAGNLFISDNYPSSPRIWKVGTNGIITTFAGGVGSTFSGDGGAATNTGLNQPMGLAFDSAGNLFIADNVDCRIRKVGTNGIISTVAGNGVYASTGNGGVATNASIANPKSVAVDASGNLFFTEGGTASLRRVGTNGIITTIAGGADGFGGDGGPSTNSYLSGPNGLAVDIFGNLFIADKGNYRIRKISTNGIITTYAGNGLSTYEGTWTNADLGDGGPATKASLTLPFGLAVDVAGNLFLGDQTGNGRVREVLAFGPTFQLSGVSTTNLGSYDVVITSASASITSSPAQLGLYKTWTGGGDGVSWSNPTNWSGGTVPTSADSIFIGVGSGTITNAGGMTLKNLICQRALAITGSLTVTGAVDVTSNLYLAPGISLTVSGTNASFVGEGTTTADQTSLYAQQGGSLNLVGLYSYSGQNSSYTLQAVGIGSVLSLPALVAITGPGGDQQILTIQAIQGAHLNLPNLQTLTHYNNCGSCAWWRGIYVIADGANSVVDMSSLNYFGGDGFQSTSKLQISNGGQILASNLQSITVVSLKVSDGLTLRLPALTNYDSGNVSYSGSVDNAGANFTASGAGSLLDLPALQTVNGSRWDEQVLTIQSIQGGRISFGSLQSISQANGCGGCAHPRGVRLFADGVSSVLDFPALTYFGGDGFHSSSAMQVSNGGQIFATNLQRIVAVSVYIADGLTLRLPALTNSASGSTSSPLLQSTGVGSVLVLTNLQTVNGPATLAQNNGGVILLKSNATYQGVTLALAPTILTQPQSKNIFVSSNVAFSVTAAGSPLFYQWFFNSTNAIIGATNATLAYSFTGYEKAGNYTVVITNAYGSATSSVAVLQVAQPLTVSQAGSGSVTRSPSQTNYTFGQSVTLTATAGRYYTFLRWSDGVTNNPRTVTVGVTNFFTAVFTNTVPLEISVLKNWERIYGGNTDESSRAPALHTEDGGFLIAGNSLSGISGNKVTASFGSSDFWLLKLDINGNKQWERVFGGNGNDDEVRGLVRTSDGRYVMGGRSDSGVSGNKSASNFGGKDVWLVKFDSNGTKVWDHNYGGSADEMLTSMIATSDGGCIITARSNSGADGNKTTGNYGGLDYWVFKIDQNGTKVWEQLYGTTGDDFLQNIIATADGGYLLVGLAPTGVSGSKSASGYGSYDFWTIKLDGNGNEIWQAIDGGTLDDSAFGACQLLDGSVVIAGGSTSGSGGSHSANNFGQNDGWAIKVGSDNQRVWDRSYGGNQIDIFDAVSPLPDGGLLLGGETFSGLTGNKLTAAAGGNDGWLKKLNANGNSVWEYGLGGTNDDNFASQLPYGDENILVDMFSNSNASGNKTLSGYGGSDLWLVSLAAHEAPVGTPIVLLDGVFAISNSVTITETNSAQVTLSTTFTNGFIYYTLDGSAPTTNSLLYTGAFNLTNTSTISRTFSITAAAWNFARTASATSDVVTVTFVTRPVFLAQSGSGTVTAVPAQTSYALGQQVTLTATAGRYYTFLNWSDGMRNNPRTITITTSNNFYAAIFTNTVPLETTLLKQWEAEFGGSGSEFLYSLQQTIDGGYILGGLTTSGPSGNKSSTNAGGYDFWVVKVDANGNKQWDQSYGGTGSDQLISLQQTSDGGYILGGLSDSGISGNKTSPNFGTYDYWLIKVDTNGVKQWEKTFGGAGDDEIYSVQQTSDGGYVLGGLSSSGISGTKTSTNFGGYDYWVIKVDASGNQQWDQSFGCTSIDALNSLQQTSDGGYLLGGYSASATSGNKTSIGLGSYDYWVVKLDATGAKLWDQTYGGNGLDQLMSLQQTSDGGHALAGLSASDVANSKTAAWYGLDDYWLVKTDAGGTKIWDQSFGGSGVDDMNAMRQAADGGYFLGGNSSSGISGNKTSPNFGATDFWVIKTDAGGNKIAEQSFGGDSNEYLLGLQTTADGGCILGGYTTSGISGNKTSVSYGSADFWIVKAVPREAPAGMPLVLVNGLYSPSNYFAIPETNAITVTLQTTYLNGFLFYTLDGSFPVAYDNAFTYTDDTVSPAPFIITNSCIVTPIAYDSNGDNEFLGDPVVISVVPVYNLTNTTPGGGSVTMNPAGGIYLSNTIVTLTPVISNGWTFMRWEGAITNTSNPLILTMDSSKSIRAVFGTSVTNTISPVGGGNVSLWPTNGPYAFGSLVRLTGVPSATNRFNRWFNNINGPTNNPLNFTVTTANTNINTFFAALTANNFTLTALLNGYGTVTRSPAQNSYASNSVVPLTAVADSGYVFTGWSGDASGLANPINVTLNTNKLVTATFASAVAPFIMAQPQSLAVNRDSNAVFSVTATGPLLAYQWLHAGTNLPSATSSTYNIASAQKADGGSYNVVITNLYGSVTSSVAVLTVNLPYTWITIAGSAGNAGSADGIGSAARFDGPIGVAVDSLNNLFIADSNNQLIRKISPAGTVITLAGLAGSAGSADGTGNVARFSTPGDVAVDGGGNVYVSDFNNRTIRKVAIGGVVTTLAGLAGNLGSADGMGSVARFNHPFGMAVDAIGNAYVADYSDNTVRKISPAGVVTTLLGLAGTSGSTDGTGSAARFNHSQDVAVDGAGNIFVADLSNNTIRKATPTGVVTTLAGLAGNAGSADGASNVAQFTSPATVAIDSAGNVIVGDFGNNTIRKVTPAGVVTTMGGFAVATGSIDGAGSIARFNHPSGVAVDSADDVFVADYNNHTIRKGIPDYGQPIIYGQPQGVAVSRDSNAVFSVSATFSGVTGYQWLHNGTNISGATGASLNLANAQKVDGGNYSVVITNSYGSATSSVAVLTVNLPYTWITIAGLAGQQGTNNGVGSAARFNGAMSVAVDNGGNVYVAEISSHTIRKITPAGVVTTFAGSAGVGGSADGTGSAARFLTPYGVAVDGSNNVYVADYSNDLIRKITPAGVVTTLAGLAGSAGSANGTGSDARFSGPQGVAVDLSGDLFITDNSKIRRVTQAGVVTTFAGGATGSGFYADGTGTAAYFSFPQNMDVDSVGNVYVADQGNSVIRKISPATVVTTVAGLAGTRGFTDGAASIARFQQPSDVAVDSSGNLFIVDFGDTRVRQMTPDGIVTTIGGVSNTPGFADGTGSAARFSSPGGVAVDSPGNLYVADYNNNTIRKGILDYGQPIIVTQPQSQSVAASASAALSVSIFTNANAIGYQWLFNGTNLNGATSNVLNIASFQAANVGPYFVVITNVYGSATSSVAVLNLAGASNQPPAITVTSPANNATFTAPINVNITVNASDADGTVANVFFRNGAATLGTTTNAPFSFTWTNAPVGTNSLTAVATDNGGLSTTSSVVNVIVQTALPQVALLSPTNGASFQTNASILVSAIASDADNSLARVEFFYQASTNNSQPTLLSSITNPPYNFTWNVATIGSYTLSARAIDLFGPIVTSAPVNITVVLPPSTNPPVFLFTTNNYFVNESNGAVVVTVLNSGDLGGLVNYTTHDGTALGGSGFSGSYTVAQGSFIFAGGQHATNLTIGIRDNFINGADINFTVQLFNPSAGTLGTPSTATVTIRQNDIGGASNSLLTTASPTAQPPTAGALRLVITPPEAGGQWRFPWEQGWHLSGDTVTTLEAGNYPIQFRDVPNYLAFPPTLSIAVTNGGTTVVTNDLFPTYTSFDTNDTGSLLVNIGPNTPAGYGWRFIGETAWRSNNIAVENLLPDIYFIEYAPVSGWSKPASQAAHIYGGQTTVLNVNYQLATSLPGGVTTTPTAVIPSQITDIANQPYGFNGQLYTDVGYGSGVAVRESVVLTAAHMVFNDAALSYVSQAWWSFQKETGTFSPKPIAARGWYVLSGYASQRTNDLQVNGYGIDQSSPQSRSLDVAALYFLEPAARNGYGGYLASDAVPNPYLTGSAPKKLVGYPVDGSYYGQNVTPGMMYATTELNTALAQASNNVYSANWFLSYPGNSGGPLYVKFNNYFYPAAVYLGSVGTGNNTVSVVRAINSEVVNLISLASSQGDSGTNFTGGGVITLVAGSINVTNLAYVLFNLGPPAAVAAGAGWRIQGVTTIYDSRTNYTLTVASSINIVIEFKPVVGWNSPTNRNYTLQAGQNPLTALYSLAPAGADLGAGISGPATIAATNNFTYTLLITNFGTSVASNVLATNTLPLGVAFVSASDGGINNAGIVTWPALTNLASGGKTNFTVTVKAPASGTLTNILRIGSTTLDTNAANNSATLITLVIVTPPMMVVNTVSGIGIVGTPGTTYRLEYRNSLSTGAWLPLKTNTIGSGTNYVLPWPPTNGAAAFYRTVWLP